MINKTIALEHKTSITYHGVFLNIFNHGVLITGESGVGKSELALTLINQGHQLIADDIVHLEKRIDEIIGYCPHALQDQLEVRSLGILNIKNLFGENAICKRKTLQMIIHLTTLPDKLIPAINRLEGLYKTIAILEKEIIQLQLPIKAGRNLALLVETAVRNQVWREKNMKIQADAIME